MKLLPFISLFFITTAFAQQLPLTVYAPRNGALFAGVNSILQDKERWMWFTSSYDVVRYDGHEFARIPLAQGVEMNFCYRIVETGDELWVLATPYPLRIDGDSLRHLSTPQISSSFIDLIEVDDRQYGLFDDGLFTYSDLTFTPLIIDETLKFSDNAHLVAFDDAYLLTFHSGQALIIFDLTTKEFKRYAIPVIDIRRDPSGTTFMLFKDQGVYRLNALHGSNEAPDIRPYALFEEPDAKYLEIDGQGNVYVGIPDKALMRINPGGTISTFTESDGLPSLWFLDMFHDREGNVWMGFNNGLCKIRNVPWHRYTREQGLYSNYIFFFLEEDDNIFLGTYSGLNAFSKGRLLQVRKGDAPFECKSMVVDGHIIYLLRDNLLLRAELDTSNFQITNEDVLSSLPATGLHLTRDASGTLFIATNAGLFVWHHKTLSQPVSGKTHYHQLLVDTHKRLWAASFSGALEIYQIRYASDGVKLEPLSGNDTLRSVLNGITQVRTLAEDSMGNIYAGTRYNGLFQLSFVKDEFENSKHFTEEHKLKSNSIWGISIDSRNDCWIATAKGINRLDGSTGLVDSEGSSAQIVTSASIYAAHNDQIWVASHPGVVLLSKDEQSITQFDIFITSVEVNSIPYDTSEVLKFDYKENNVSFSFSTNTFLDEEEVYYSYRLSQHDDGDWSTSSLVHNIQYPALQPGNYIFQVKAAGPYGHSANSAEIAFVITPPFWQRAWFIGLLIAAVCLIAWTLYRFRIRQLTQLHQMRNNISRNLHDDIGASLSNINILNALTLRHLRTPAKAENYLTQASEDIQRISESLSDIVWNVNPMNDDLDHVFSHMKRYAADMLEGKNIAAEFDFPSLGSKTHLSMDKRRDFFLIFKEAINNMAKYSQATKAKISVHEEGNTLHLVIEDNGIGFDPNMIKAGNGLHNMRHRAENWGALFEVKSEKGKGTRVELRIRR